MTLLTQTETEGGMSEKMKAFRGILIAKNQYAELYAEKLELADFKFLSLTIVGPYDVKTSTGFTVGLTNDIGITTELETDTTEIISDYNKKLHLGITQFDIDLEDKIIEQILKDRIHKIWVDMGDEKSTFTIEDSKILKEIILVSPSEENTEIIEEENNESENLPELKQKEESV